MFSEFFIAVDSGKSYTKGVLRSEDAVIERVRFRTKVMESSGFGGDLLMRNTDVVEYDGVKYLIGEAISESYTDFNLSKQTNEHLICIYLAITKLLDRSDMYTAMAKVNLAVNIPLNIFKYEHKKKEFEAFIQNNKKVIGIKVNGKPYSFILENVVALPEALGPIFYQTDQYRHKRILVVDIGSLNTSILECNNLVPAYDKMLVSNLGVNVLRSSLSEQLSSLYAITFTNDDTEQILREKTIRINGTEQEEASDIIQKAFEEHVRQIINYARGNKVSFANTELLFVGGGSILFRKQLKAHFPDAKYLAKEDASFANTLSFLKILEVKFGEQKEA